MASLATWLRTCGIDPKRAVVSLRGIGKYLRDRKAFRASLGNDFHWAGSLPILDEWNDRSGSLGAYFHQDQMVARWIHEAVPRRHLDVGSRIDGFIGHLAVFREVEVLDIRPQDGATHNVRFHQVDLMAELSEEWIECTDSLSCLHTIEHFGLGRYGDAIDPNGHLKGLEQLKRMARPGGVLYLSTPIGPQRVEFNAHRVFAARTVVDWFTDGWKIERFAVIDDGNRVHEAVDWTSREVESHFGCQLGVGIVAARRVL